MAARALGAATLAACGLLAAATEQMMKGISYGVSPSRTELPRNDDFMCDEAAPQWNHSGRGDLALIQALGANSVRMYGNDPRLSHRGFLDEAHRLGLRVIPGNSDWPFMQAPDSCKVHTNYDCRAQVNASYLQNLQRGFLLENGTYHPALSYIVVMNEPDMKVPNVEHPTEFCRAIISAMDGMLDAEREANVSGPLPNLTVTFSWSLCATCGEFGDKPGLGQMWQLRDAMLHPGKYGYTPRNNLTELYRTRFVHSFNTANPSFHIRPLFLDFYEPAFPDTPIFVGEYHWNNPRGNQQEDVEKVLAIVEASPLLLGISYFEFQLRTDLGGHLDFGMFRQGSPVLADMAYFGQDYEITCVTPVRDFRGRSLPAQVARAYGGSPKLFETEGCLTGGRGTSSGVGTVTTTVTETATTATTTTATTTTATATAEPGPAVVQTTALPGEAAATTAKAGGLRGTTTTTTAAAAAHDASSTSSSTSSAPGPSTTSSSGAGRAAAAHAVAVALVALVSEAVL